MDWKAIEKSLQRIGVDFGKERWLTPKTVAEIYGESDNLAYVFVYRYKDTPLVRRVASTNYINVAVLDEVQAAKRRCKREALDLYYGVLEHFGSQTALARYLADKTGKSVQTWNTFLSTRLADLSEQSAFSLIVSEKRVLFVELAKEFLEKIVKNATQESCAV